MQASVENTSSIGRKLSVVVPAEKIESAVQVKLQKLRKTVKIQGFRPGKVPLKIVDQQYRGSVTGDAVNNLIQESLYQALTDEKLVPAVQPDIIPEQLEKGKDLSYVASFDVFPQFEKLDLEGVTVNTPVSEVLDEDVDRTIETMRKQRINWKEVQRKSIKGDRALIDFTGTVDGEEFEGGAATDYPIVLGEGRMLADFEKGIIGMKAGETRNIDVIFPEDYQTELASKKAVFNIEVKTVSESELPEINEEFITAFGIESGKQEDFRSQIKENLVLNLEQQLSSMMHQRVFDALSEQNEVEVPHKMVVDEAKRMVQEQKNQLQQQGMDPSVLPEPEFETLEPQAKKRVTLSLLVSEIVSKNDIKPNEKRVREYVEKMATSYENSKEFFDYYLSNQEALAQVQSVVLEQQVVDQLLESAKVKEEKLKASEVLNMQ